VEGAYEPQASNPCHLFTWPETCGRERHVPGIRKAFGRRRLESRVLHYRFVATASGGWGSCGRSIQLEPPPAHDHRLILIPRQAEQHASAAAWKEGLADLPIFADCSAVLRRPMNFQIWSNQIRGARSCWKSLYSANSDIRILSLIYQSWHSPWREGVWGRRDMAPLIFNLGIR